MVNSGYMVHCLTRLQNDERRNFCKKHICFTCYMLQENYTNWGLNHLVTCSPTCTGFGECVYVRISATALNLPRSLFSLCSLLLLRTISSITKSSKTPTKIQEMVTSIFNPSLVASPSSLCTTDLMSGGIVPGNSVMILDAY